MFSEAKLHDEPGRLAALDRFEVLDTPPEQQFEEITALVRTVLGVPMAAVTLLDEGRQWMKSQAGLGLTETPRSMSFCKHTIMQRMPMVISDARADVRFMNNALVAGEPGIGSYAGVPLCTADGYNLGALCAIDTRAREFTPADLGILDNLARIVVKELELRCAARRDPLTGALSRRGFMEKADVELTRLDRYNRPSCMVMMDIDHFKAVNDTHGHPAGDAVLRELAGLLTMLKRPVDSLGRLGGEEFALVLPETEPEEAMAAAERFRQSISNHAVCLPCGTRVEVTASFGIAPARPDMGTAEQWLAAADVPLYGAKRAGRNRCHNAVAGWPLRLIA